MSTPAYISTEGTSQDAELLASAPSKRILLKQSFDDLRDWLSVARSAQDVEEGFAQFAARNGYKWFTYLALHEVNIRGISNYPRRWQEIYLKNQLVTIDPIIRRVTAEQKTFVWSTSTLGVLSRDQQAFIKQAQENGIRSGLSIPIIAGYNTMAVITLASSSDHPVPTSLSDQYILMSMGTYLDNIMRKMDGVLLGSDCPLTVTQLECLSWLLQGKTNDEVAIIRGVSRRTIEYQLQLIREKLGASTTVQAVGIALERKWLTL